MVSSNQCFFGNSIHLLGPGEETPFLVLEFTSVLGVLCILRCCTIKYYKEGIRLTSLKNNYKGHIYKAFLESCLYPSVLTGKTEVG